MFGTGTQSPADPQDQGPCDGGDAGLGRTRGLGEEGPEGAGRCPGVAGFGSEVDAEFVASRPDVICGDQVREREIGIVCERPRRRSESGEWCVGRRHRDRSRPNDSVTRRSVEDLDDGITVALEASMTKVATLPRTDYPRYQPVSLDRVQTYLQKTLRKCHSFMPGWAAERSAHHRSRPSARKSLVCLECPNRNHGW